MRRFFEEMFPIGSYICNIKKVKNALNSLDGQDHLESSYKDYYQLPPEKLSERLTAEHQRAKDLDEKTYKMTLALTIGLTVLGTTLPALTKDISSELIKGILNIEIFVSVLYILIGGLIALGALKTQPFYGFGTDFEIESTKVNKTPLIEVLVKQEKMNILRQLRNETSYQCLRNGMYLFVITLIFLSLSNIFYKN